MSKYECSCCGEDGNSDPVVGIIFYPSEQINKNLSGVNLRAFYHGLAYGDSAQDMREQEEKFHSIVSRTMRNNIEWFCSISCLKKFHKKLER